MNTQFDELVHGLDQATLELLRRSVSEEVEQRREQTAIQLEHIHARMSDAQREEAAREIARVLRGEPNA